MYNIEDVEDQVIYSEMNVLNALLDVCFKEAEMLEYCSEEVVQEGVFGQALDMTREELQGKNIVVKILTFIFKYIKNLFKAIFSKSKKTEQTMDRIMKDIDKTDELIKNLQKNNKVDDAKKAVDQIEKRHKAYMYAVFGDAKPMKMEITDTGVYFESRVNFEGIHQLLMDIHKFHTDAMNLVETIKTKDDLNRMRSKIDSYTTEWTKLIDKYAPDAKGDAIANIDAIMVVPFILHEKQDVGKFTPNELKQHMGVLRKEYKQLKYLNEFGDKGLLSHNPLYDALDVDESCPLKSSDLTPLRKVTGLLNSAFIQYFNMIDKYFEYTEESFNKSLEELHKMQENALKISKEITRDVDLNDPKYAKIKDDIINNPDKVVRILKGDPNREAKDREIDKLTADVDDILDTIHAMDTGKMNPKALKIVKDTLLM